jgi:hypothetical protein
VLLVTANAGLNTLLTGQYAAKNQCLQEK